MPLDTSIYSQIRAPELNDPLAQYAKIQQIQGAQNQNRLADLMYGEKQREAADDVQLRELTRQSGGDQNKLRDLLYQGGNYKQGMAIDKALTERKKAGVDIDKTQIETATKRLDLAGQAFGYVRSNPSVETAHAALDYLGQNGVYSPEQVAQYKAKVQADPTKVGEMADMAFRAALSAKDQLAKYETRNTGGTTDTLAIDPVTGKARTVNSVQNTQSPDSKASQATAIRGQNMTDARARESLQQGKVPAGYRANPDGSLSFIPGGPADPSVGGAKLTEDQGKATGWLVQAENAFKNMQASGFDAKGNRKGAAVPGINDAIAAFPGAGGLANMMRTEDRQKFIQSSASLSEALLRAATGAGVNESEAKQKIAELTPLFGEAESVTKQKMDAIPLYIESLKVRAGPGAKKAAGIGGGATGDFSQPAGMPSGFKVIRD